MSIPLMEVQFDKPGSIKAEFLGVHNLFNRFLIPRYRLVVAVLVASVVPVTSDNRAEAMITKITIDSIQSPTFGGVSFGEVEQYEKLVGRAFGEHTAEVLRECDHNDEEMEMLRREGILIEKED